MSSREIKGGRRKRWRYAAVSGWLITMLAILGSVHASTAQAGTLGEIEIGADDVSTQIFSGASSSSGSISASANPVRIGDANGDGIDDFAVIGGSGAPGNRGIYVLYSKLDRPSVNLADLPPSDGYRVRQPSGVPTSVDPAGDQNGDGVPDLLVRFSTNLLVLFGIPPSSVGTLPLCAAGQTRCMDIPAATAEPWLPSSPASGYKVSGVTSDPDAGDFNGDGSLELAVNNSATNKTFVLPNGLAAGQTVALASGTVPEGTSTFTGASSLVGTFGSKPKFVGDVNGDGRDDLSMFVPPFGDSGADMVNATGVFYGKASASTVNGNDISENDGYRLLYTDQLLSLGDAIGVPGLSADGRSGVAVAGDADALGNSGQIAFIRSPNPDESTTLAMFPPDPEFGYRVTDAAPAASGGLTNQTFEPVGDINGDGIGEVAQTSSVDVNGVATTGRVTIFFPDSSFPGSDVVFGPEMDGRSGFSLVGAPGQKIRGFTGIGDVDGDGLEDLLIAGDSLVTPGAGAIYQVLGKDLVAQAQSGPAGQISDTGATLHGTSFSKSQDVDVSFEYGETANYGSSTSPVEVGASGRVASVESEVTGLDPETTYHYRVNVTNELGLTRVGADRTFTTDAVPLDPPCVADPGAPGCAGYCAANPSAVGCAGYCDAHATEPGCPGYNYCAANPGEAGCKPAVGRLSGLIVNNSSVKVKRGKKTTIRATVVNTGTAAAEAVKVCASGPKSLIRIAKSCVSVGSLAAGDSKTTSFVITVRKNAKRGKKAAIGLSATATNLEKRSAKSTVKVG